jgi:hypothetical protein
MYWWFICADKICYRCFGHSGGVPAINRAPSWKDIASKQRSKNKPESTDGTESFSSDRDHCCEDFKLKCFNTAKARPLHRQFQGPGAKSRKSSL